MSRVLEFSGRSKLDKVTHKGTGVNLIDGELWLINGDDVLCPIEETSLRIRRSYQYEKFESPITTMEDLSDLQNELMSTAIRFCRERNLTDIDILSFGADGIQDSVEYGEWTPATDSSLVAHGYENDKQKLIGEVL